MKKEATVSTKRQQLTDEMVKGIWDDISDRSGMVDGIEDCLIEDIKNSWEIIIFEKLGDYGVLQ